MAGGKASVSGGGAWVTPLPFTISVRSMRLRAKTGMRPLTVFELRKDRKDLRYAFKIYQISCATPNSTPTERRKMLGSIKTAARNLAKAPPTAFKGGTFTGQKRWADRLLDEINAADKNTLAIITRVIGRRNWAPFRKHLSSVARSLPGEAHEDQYLSEYISTVQYMANINIEDFAPTRARWPDPPLASLVMATAPIWKRVTGRTAGLVSTDNGGDLKESPFADWLQELLAKIGLPSPPVGRVVDIIRHNLKNPAPATGG